MVNIFERAKDIMFSNIHTLLNKCENVGDIQFDMSVDLANLKSECGISDERSAVLKALCAEVGVE